MSAIRVLLAGESWISAGTHYKGWDFFSSTVYETGMQALAEALTTDGVQFTHLPGHLAPAEFPLTLEQLGQVDVLMLSDLGANSLLLHPDTWLRGRSVPNRLKLIRAWVEGGGGLVMCGGYYSFAGIYGQAKYYRTAVEEVLPVSIFPFDDRVEAPEGVMAELVQPDHPIVQGIAAPWPYLLGYNELTLRPEAELIAKVGDHPLLAVRQVGQGRTLIWASDIGPHWCPEVFVHWDGYRRLWRQAIRWLAAKD